MYHEYELQQRIMKLEKYFSRMLKIINNKKKLKAWRDEDEEEVQLKLCESLT